MQTTTQKPQLTFWQIWNMSFGFLGIQFGFGLQNANVSRIFETLGHTTGHELSQRGKLSIAKAC